MKRRSPVCLLTLAAALGIADRAAADHRDVEYQLRIQFDQRMADLESDFRIHREHLERSKRRAFAEIEIARQQARSMCEPQRTHALRALDSRRHELEIAYRSRMQQLQAQTEFSRNRLRFERDSELAQLRDKHRANYRPRTNYPMPGFSQPPLAPSCRIQQDPAGYAEPVFRFDVEETEIIESPAEYRVRPMSNLQIPLGRLGVLRIAF